MPKRNFRVLLWCLLMPGFASSALAQTEVETSDLAESDALVLDEILSSEAVIDPRHSADDEALWALKMIYKQGFAVTSTTAKTLKQTQIFGGLSRDWSKNFLKETLKSRLRLDARHEAALAASTSFDIPLASHPLVDLYIDYFTGRGRWHFAKYLERSERYIPLMVPILERHGLPRDLVYVAMIESGFSARATSTAAACGYWQFIRSTGNIYGLRSDFWIDERRDFLRATESAARYLADLHREFKDWHLAWAGYNAGAGRIRRALNRNGVSDFWSLIEIKDRKLGLARETRDYVPKIIAAAIIAKNRQRYGFEELAPLGALSWEEITVEDAIDLRVLAKKLAIEPDILRELNPSILHDVTPPGKSHSVRVPVGTSTELSVWLTELPRAERLTYQIHTIVKGDTLSVLAARYSTNSDAIAQFNRITNPRSLKIGQNLIVPILKTATSTPQPKPAKPAVTLASNAQIVVPETQNVQPAIIASSGPGQTDSKSHVVSQGETLWSISRRYGTSVEDLRVKNGLKNNTISVGENLKVF